MGDKKEVTMREIALDLSLSQARDRISSRDSQCRLTETGGLAHQTSDPCFFLATFPRFLNFCCFLGKAPAPARAFPRQSSFRPRPVPPFGVFAPTPCFLWHWLGQESGSGSQLPPSRDRPCVTKEADGIMMCLDTACWLLRKHTPLAVLPERDAFDGESAALGGLSLRLQASFSSHFHFGRVSG